MTETRTHDFGSPNRRYWGHDYTFRSNDRGQTGTAMGWGWDGRRIQAGDFLLLQNGDRSSRYYVHTIKHLMDPPDMWAAELYFAPRRTFLADSTEKAP